MGFGSEEAPVTTIKATCPTCGDVDLTPFDLVVDDGGQAASYTFTCPSCVAAITKSAGREIVNLLADAGVTVRRPGPPPLPPFTYDDVLDFALRLEQTEDVLAALLTPERY
jgi:predicted RNA-binding Zn-ribbon protein involved in translation (DUF1610 family)